MSFSAIWNNKTFGESIYTCKASIVEAEEDQSNLLKNLVEFNTKYKSKEGKDKKVILWKCIGKVKNLTAFKSGIFHIKTTKGEGLENINS